MPAVDPVGCLPRSRRRAGRLRVLLLPLLVCGPVLACDHSVGIPAGGPAPQVIDGATLDAGGPVPAGALVCVQAGSYDRGKLEFRNFIGRAGQPIRIMNNAGVVEVSDGRLYLNDSQHVEFAGDGDAGASHGFRVVAGAEEGFSIRQSAQGRPPIQGIHAHHVEVFYRDAFGPQAVGVHNVEKVPAPDPIHDVRLSHFYIHRGHDGMGQRTGGYQEGFYINSSFYDLEPVPQLSGIRIDHSLVVDPGWDGIQIGAAEGDCEIDHNVILRDSRYRRTDQNAGVMIAKGSSCNVHHNRILGGNGPGIYHQGNGDRNGTARVEDGGHIYANLIEPWSGVMAVESNPREPEALPFPDERRWGVRVVNARDDLNPERLGHVYIYGNSVADSPVAGIHLSTNPARIAGFVVINNLLVDTASGVSPAVHPDVHDNLTSSRAAIGFSSFEEVHGDPVQHFDGLRLKADSAGVIDRGVGWSGSLMNTDIDDQRTTRSGPPDIGADTWAPAEVWFNGFESE